MIGDIVGRPGRKAIREILPRLVKSHKVDFVLANGENAAGGNGITWDIADELFSYGIDVLTTGNHVWDKREVFDFINDQPRVIRPGNYPPGSPGNGSGVFSDLRGVKVGVVNLSGRVFLPALDCPFRKADEILTGIGQETPIIVLDFHAEATSEKMAMGWYLDGRVSAVVGTHTHVQTADERVLPGGTAYISDVGMTGPRDSVIGVKKEIIVDRFLTHMPRRFEVASGPYQFNAVLLDLDEVDGRANSIDRLFITEEG
jgi:metallophosphoesterase (TIGR00282 family)